MRAACEKGLTLIELVLAITITGIIASAGTALLWTCLEAQGHGEDRSRLYQEGLMAMERMTAGIRKTTVVLVPNGHSPTRDILAFSRLVNSDGDFYFADPLFPRVDEDPHDYFSFGSYGIKGVDEDGDGMLDEENFKDEDEDGSFGEEPIDGLDNDGDGAVDEEVQPDYDMNGVPGISNMDDDGDNLVDEVPNKPADDDEDDLINEEEILFAVYSYNASAKTLTEIHSHSHNGIYDPAPRVVLSDHVTNFEAFFDAPERIRITMTLTGDDGESVTFCEYVCPRNALQRKGKRVR
jgi:prepilin-type N-terminal cleavage/methylation domain-containing protein